MDFSLSEAQTELAGLARKILAAQDAPQRQRTVAIKMLSPVPASSR